MTGEICRDDRGLGDIERRLHVQAGDKRSLTLKNPSTRESRRSSCHPQYRCGIFVNNACKFSQLTLLSAPACSSFHSIGSCSSCNSPTQTAACHLEETEINAIAQNPRRPHSSFASGFLRNTKRKKLSFESVLKPMNNFVHGFHWEFRARSTLSTVISIFTPSKRQGCLFCVVVLEPSPPALPRSHLCRGSMFRNPPSSAMSSLEPPATHSFFRTIFLWEGHPPCHQILVCLRRQLLDPCRNFEPVLVPGRHRCCLDRRRRFLQPLLQGNDLPSCSSSRQARDSPGHNTRHLNFCLSSSDLGIHPAQPLVPFLTLSSFPSKVTTTG